MQQAEDDKSEEQKAQRGCLAACGGGWLVWHGEVLMRVKWVRRSLCIEAGFAWVCVNSYAMLPARWCLVVNAPDQRGDDARLPRCAIANLRDFWVGCGSYAFIFME